MDSKLETTVTKDYLVKILHACQMAGDNAGLGKVLSAHLSNNQITAVYVHGMIQFNSDGVGIDLKKFN